MAAVPDGCDLVSLAESEGLSSVVGVDRGKALKRGSFYNVDDLVGAITEYVNRHNENPKPFIWTASAKDILAKVKRARRAADKL